MQLYWDCIILIKRIKLTLEDFFPLPHTPPPPLSDGTTDTLRQHRWFIPIRRLFFCCCCCCCCSWSDFPPLVKRIRREPPSRCSPNRLPDFGSLNENGWNLMRNWVRVVEWWFWWWWLFRFSRGLPIFVSTPLSFFADDFFTTMLLLLALGLDDEIRLDANEVTAPPPPPASISPLVTTDFACCCCWWWWWCCCWYGLVLVIVKQLSDRFFDDLENSYQNEKKKKQKQFG